MEKRGGRGRASVHEDPREKRGLGAVDVIAIMVVIMLLGTAFGALVVDRSMRSMRAAHPGDSWVGRLAESVAEEAPPASPAAR